MAHLAGTFSDGRATTLRRIYHLGWCFSVNILRAQGNMQRRLFKSAGDVTQRRDKGDYGRETGDHPRRIQRSA